MHKGECTVWCNCEKFCECGQTVGISRNGNKMGVCWSCLGSLFTEFCSTMGITVIPSYSGNSSNYHNQDEKLEWTPELIKSTFSRT